MRDAHVRLRRHRALVMPVRILRTLADVYGEATVHLELLVLRPPYDKSRGAGLRPRTCASSPQNEEADRMGYREAIVGLDLLQLTKCTRGKRGPERNRTGTG